ncbi:carbohydrate ABC transporter permease [Curtobacterium sp. MCBD17_019]|uniref:carbohydrate ABC transporter permease n=1 Tax=Curtobacterium sp. MCBD17_019 TaxID=2175669 RepID=UPI000DAA0B31|nr:carbohydrate ABC transporter permease [Curtobacterium sp. MCBD17_019]PZE73891.1 carbohydrate ABC transporter permease [Curtobacterium sp. MCBD17_019]
MTSSDLRIDDPAVSVSAQTGDARAPQLRRTRERRWTRKNTILFVVGVVVGVLAIFPLVYMVLSSFKGESEIFSGSLLPAHWTLSNFVYVFTQVPFARYMLNSAFVSAVVTVAALWFHSMAAYALARLRFRGRETVFLIIFSTLLVSLPVVLIPEFEIVRLLGMLDSYWGLIVPSIFNAFGIFLLRQFYMGLPDELEEAALVDGAGYWRIYWSVVLPLSRPILSALAVFFFLANWNSFVWPLTITSNPNLRVVQVGIATFHQQYASSESYIVAASTVAAIPTLLLFFFFQKQITESIKTAGFK